MKAPITYLFVPGSRPDRFEKAHAAGADAVILDLEDAVAPEAKDAARAAVAAWIAAHPEARARTVVRINDAASPWFAADLAALSGNGVEVVMLPKSERCDAIDAVRAALGPALQVLALIETAAGVDNADAIAATPGVQRLMFGNLDYAADLDLSGDERGLVYPSARLAHASRAAGLVAPVAGVTPAIDDDAQLLADLAFARAFGFGAKACIHPRQVGVIRQAMRPTPAELDWARRVLAAAAGAAGVAQVDGKMVDRPVLIKARGFLDRAAD
jgi:citrate lyase subunit beta/citryl-CoA lyase